MGIRTHPYISDRESPRYTVTFSFMPSDPEAANAPVRGVVLLALPRFGDARGALTVAEIQKHIPFAVARLFLVYDVPEGEVRGRHAHREQHQFLICVHGACVVSVDDGGCRNEYRLDAPTQALYVPPMIWSEQHSFTPGAVLAVLASAPYD